MSAIDDMLDNNTWTGEHRNRARVELARLRRMADAYAADAVRESWDPGEDNGLPGNRWLCVRCLRDEWKGTPILHTATCDVAAHLDLPREKGEGSE